MKNERIRVLMVMDSLDVGGTETHVLSIIKALKKLEITTIYAGANGIMYEDFAQVGCPIHIIDLSPAALCHMHSETLPTIITPLQQVMHKRKINIVHVHQTPSGIYAAMAAKQLGIPVVFTTHGTYYPKDEIQIMQHYSDAIISVSNPIHKKLACMNIHSEIIPNGIDTTDFQATDASAIRAQLGIPPMSHTIVYISRLSWDKASVCKMLVLAAQKLSLNGVSPLHVVIVGHGQQFHEIQELANYVQQRTKHFFIHMVGIQKQVCNYFSLGDIVVGTGRVALEAMACGKPVLAIGNHGFFGFVTPNSYTQAWRYYFGDHDSIYKPSEGLIAQSLRGVLADKDILQWIGAQGRKWILQHFDIDKIVERIVNLYKQVIKLNE